MITDTYTSYAAIMNSQLKRLSNPCALTGPAATAQLMHRYRAELTPQAAAVP
jgi:hypothetical protein